MKPVLMLKVVTQLLAEESPPSDEECMLELAEPLFKEIGCDPITPITTSVQMQTEMNEVTSSKTQTDRAPKLLNKSTQVLKDCARTVMCSKSTQTITNTSEKGNNVQSLIEQVVFCTVLQIFINQSCSGILHHEHDFKSHPSNICRHIKMLLETPPSPPTQVLGKY